MDSMMQKIGLAFLITAAVAGYLGLAVLGWGGLAAFASHPARIAIVVVSFALVAAALLSSGNLSSGVREDRGNRWVIAALGLIGILDAYLPAYTDRQEIFTLDGDTVR